MAAWLANIGTRETAATAASATATAPSWLTSGDGDSGNGSVGAGGISQLTAQESVLADGLAPFGGQRRRHAPVSTNSAVEGDLRRSGPGCRGRRRP